MVMTVMMEMMTSPMIMTQIVMMTKERMKTMIMKMMIRSIDSMNCVVEAVIMTMMKVAVMMPLVVIR